MHACMHIIHAYTRACVHAYMRTCVHAYMRTCVHAYMRTCVHAYMRTCVHAYMRTSVHVYMRIHAYMHTCTHTYIHRPTYVRSVCKHAREQARTHGSTHTNARTYAMHTCMHVYMYPCVLCIGIFPQTHVRKQTYSLDSNVSDKCNRSRDPALINSRHILYLWQTVSTFVDLPKNTHRVYSRPIEERCALQCSYSIGGACYLLAVCIWDYCRSIVANHIALTTRPVGLRQTYMR